METPQYTGPNKRVLSHTVVRRWAGPPGVSPGTAIPWGSEALLSFTASLPAGMKETAAGLGLWGPQRGSHEPADVPDTIHLSQAREHASCLVDLE